MSLKCDFTLEKEKGCDCMEANDSTYVNTSFRIIILVSYTNEVLGIRRYTFTQQKKTKNSFPVSNNAKSAGVQIFQQFLVIS